MSGLSLDSVPVTTHTFPSLTKFDVISDDLTSSETSLSVLKRDPNRGLAATIIPSVEFSSFSPATHAPLNH